MHFLVNVEKADLMRMSEKESKIQLEVIIQLTTLEQLALTLALRVQCTRALSVCLCVFPWVNLKQ